MTGLPPHHCCQLLLQQSQGVNLCCCCVLLSELMCPLMGPIAQGQAAVTTTSFPWCQLSLERDRDLRCSACFLPALCSEDPPHLLIALVWPQSSFLLSAGEEQSSQLGELRKGLNVMALNVTQQGCVSVCKIHEDREKHKEIVKF